MGEFYKGLTIRFNGDTSQLKKELNAMNSSLRASQKALRDTQKAIDFDPHGLTLMKNYIAQLGSKVEASTTKIKLLDKQIKNLSSMSIDELVTGAAKFAEKAVTANNRYAEVDYKLAAIKDKMDLAARTGKTQQGILDEHRVTQEEILKLAVKNGDVTREEYNEYKRLVAKHNELLKAKEDIGNIKEASKLALELQKLEAETKKDIIRLAELKSTASSAFEKYQKEARKTEVCIDSLSDSTKQAEKEANSLKLKLDFGDKTKENYVKYIDSLREALTSTKAEISLLEKQANKFDKTIQDKAVKKSIAEANAELTKAKLNVEKIEKEFADACVEVRKLEDDTSTSTNSLEKAKQEAKKLENQLEAAHKTAQDKVLVVQFKKVKTAIAEATGNATKLESRMKIVKNQARLTAGVIRSIGSGLSYSVSPYAKMGFSKIIESSETIDSAYRDMRKTVNGTEEQFESLKQSAIEFSQTHVTSADQILEIQALGGQLGIGAEDLDSFAEAISNIDIATNVNSEDASVIVGQLINILDDLDAENVDKFSNSLVRLGNNNAALESDILEVTQRIGSAGSIYKMTTPQILAWSTAIASTGQKSESAGTAISKTMSMIESATVKGGDKLKGFAEVAGMSSKEFKEKWQTDASGAMQSFVEGLHKVDESGGSVDATLINLGITGVRQKQALNGLSQTVDTLNSSLSMSQDAWNNGTDAADEANKKAEGFSGQVQIFRNNIQVLAESLGESLTPILQGVNSIVEALTTTFKGMPDGIKVFTVGIFAAFAAVSSVITVISIVKTVLDQAGISFKKAEKDAAKYGAEQIKISEETAAAVVKILEQVAAEEALDTATDDVSESMDRAAASTERYGTATQKATSRVVSLSSVQSTTAAKVKATTSTLSGSTVVVSNYGTAAKKTGEQVSKSSKKATDAMTKAGKGTSKLKSLASGATGGVIGLATAAVGLAITLGTELYDEYKKNEAATEGLINAQEIAQGEMDDTGEAASDLSDRLKEARDEAADLAEELQSNWKEYYNNKGQVEALADQIEKYSKNVKTAKKHQDELKAAVDKYNEITGAALDATNLTKDGLIDLRKQLEATKEEWIKYQGNLIYSSTDAQLKSARQELQKTYDEALEAYKNDPTDANGAALKTATDQLNNNTAALSKNNAQWDAFNKGEKTYKTSLKSLINQNEVLGGAIDAGGVKIGTFAKKYKKAGRDINSFKGMDWSGFETDLAQAGMKLSDFAKLSSDEMKVILDAYSTGNIDSLSLAINSLGITPSDDNTYYVMWIKNIKSIGEAAKDGSFDIKDFVSKLDAAGIEFDELGQTYAGLSFDDFASGLKDNGYTISNFSNLSSEQIKKVIDAWKNGKGDIKTILESLPDDIKNALNVDYTDPKSDEKLTNAAKKKAKKYKTAFNKALGDSTNGYDAFAAAQQAGVETYAKKSKKSAKSATAEVAKKFQLTEKQIKNLINVYKNSGQDTGIKWLEGLNLGIKDEKTLKELAAAVIEVANLIDTAAKSKGGTWTNSPSKKARIIGNYWTEGLALGITDNQTEVYKAAQRAANMTNRVQIPTTQILSASKAALQETAYNASVSVNSDISSIAGAVGEGMASLNSISNAKKVTINLNYSQDADANQMVVDIANGLRRLNMVGA